MAEEDLTALVAFLRTVPPVNRPNTPKKITVPMFESVFLPAWLMAFAATETPPPTAPAAGVARGEYLVRAVGHCGECHTPRSGLTMAVDNSQFLAGNPKKTGPEGQAAPNITPDKTTGHRRLDRGADRHLHGHGQPARRRRRGRPHGAR